MELIRQWLTQVVAAAVLGAASDALMADGPVKQAGKLVCALVLLCAVLRPVLNWNMDVRVCSSDVVGMWNESWVKEVEQEGGDIMKTLIEEQTQAYILDKAVELGVDCRAEVECVEQDGLWVPEQVLVFGRLQEEQRAGLTAVLLEELGIRPKYQNDVGGE